MKALILAAGRGERLKPITNNTPKCLVKIKGVPLLETILKKIEKTDIKEIFINTHYLEEKVFDFFMKYKGKLKVNFLEEKKLKGTGGTLIDNLDLFERQDLLVLHADNYFAESLKNFVKAHQRRNKRLLVTLISFITDDPKNCGICEINKKISYLKFMKRIKIKQTKLPMEQFIFFQKNHLVQ